MLYRIIETYLPNVQVNESRRKKLVFTSTYCCLILRVTIKYLGSVTIPRPLF